MTDLKPAAEVAQQFSFWDGAKPTMECIAIITADREAVAERVREKCMHEVAALKHPHDGVDTRAIWSNAAYGDAVAAIRNLPLEVLLEND